MILLIETNLYCS